MTTTAPRRAAPGCAAPRPSRTQDTRRPRPRRRWASRPPGPSARLVTLPPLRHAVHLGLLGLESRPEPHVHQHVAGQDGALAAHAREEEVNRLHCRRPSSQFIARNLMASRGRFVHTPRSPCTRRCRSVPWAGPSSRPARRSSGWPDTRCGSKSVQPLHASAITSSGTQRLRATGSSAHSSRVISTDGSSSLRYSLSVFSISSTAQAGTVLTWLMPHAAPAARSR